METEPGLLITGARVYTADPARPWADAVLTSGDRVHYVGTEVDARHVAGNDVEVLNIPGGLVVPGLNDAHVHMTMAGYNLTILNLEGVFTVPELQARLVAYANAHPERTWIEAYGLPYEPLTGLDVSPRKILDDAISNRPVYVRAFDSHSSWSNTQGLKMAGIDRGADLPLPNEVVVNNETGLATGMLKESLAHALVASAIGSPTMQQRDDMLCDAMSFVNRMGICSVQNMDADRTRLDQYERLRALGRVSVRAGHYLSVREGMSRDYLDECAALVREFTDPWNRATGVKLFIDGVVESKTALMVEPYADGTEDTGVPDMDLEVYREIVIAADALGMDVATHAIGDCGIQLTLDAYQAATEQNRGTRQRRHRVEHIEVIQPGDIPRFGKLGVTASMQPLHAAPTTDPRTTPWTSLVGTRREPYAFNWRSLSETGASLAFGSDWPIVTPDPRLGMHVAITRTTATGEPRGGWHPQQCVTLAQALDAYTRGAARVERQERVKGMLRPGLLADITVFAHDLFTIPTTEMRTVPVALTVVGGRIVHRLQ